MPLPHQHPENQLPKFRVKIAQKDHIGNNRIVTEEAHNRDEARNIVEGKYPGFDIIWVE